MNSFNFQPSIRVIFGLNALSHLGETIVSAGAQRVLIITDPGIIAAGIVRQACDSLENHRIEYTVFSDVVENPTDAHVERGAKEIENSGIPEMLIAIGGGSAMDCAKGINFLLTNGGKMEDYWGFGKANHPMLPSIGIPTTAGTGSEAQSYALISRSSDHRKMACGDIKVRFQTVILDPALLATLPAETAAITAMDAFSHALESYVCTKHNAISDMFARTALRHLDRSVTQFLENPGNTNAGSEMMIGANLAGMAIENSMLGAAHALANPLTAVYGITHGIAVGIMLPYVMRFNARIVGERYAELLPDNPVKGDAVEYLCSRISAIQSAGKLPVSLENAGVQKNDFGKLAENAAEQWTGRFNPVALDKKNIINLYNEAW